MVPSHTAVVSSRSPYRIDRLDDLSIAACLGHDLPVSAGEIGVIDTGQADPWEPLAKGLDVRVSLFLHAKQSRRVLPPSHEEGLVMKPTLAAEEVRRNLTQYLTTTFALADEDVRDGLAKFLDHPELVATVSSAPRPPTSGYGLR